MAGNTLLFSEILDKVHKAKTKDQKVRILRENNTAALRSLLISCFDPKIQWVIIIQNFNHFLMRFQNYIYFEKC